jgi:hypothetical protein
VQRGMGVPVDGPVVSTGWRVQDCAPDENFSAELAYGETSVLANERPERHFSTSRSITNIYLCDLFNFDSIYYRIL